MTSTPPRVPIPLALALGGVSGFATHLPFVALGRSTHPWVGVAAAFAFCAFDPLLTLPTALLVRRRALPRPEAVRFGALAGAVSGSVVGLLVATSALDGTPAAPSDAGALVYPLVACAYGALAGLLASRRPAS